MALTPLFARYKDHPRVMTWEVFNEPEWGIWNNTIAKEPAQATVKAIAEAVHANSRAYVTIGAAMLDGLPLWTGLGLDYYRAHWYDYMSGGGWCARCTDYATVKARYNLDAPLVIGEVYAGPDTDALQRFKDFYAKGYAGAYAWSLFWDRTSDQMRVDQAAARTFASRHADSGPRATPPPPSTIATTTPSQRPGFISGATVSPATVTPGGSVTITSAVTSGTAGAYLVDVEVSDPTGARVHQQWWDNQAFAAGEARSYASTWTAPVGAAAGAYTVTMGVFSPGWGTLYHWNDAAVSFTVEVVTSTSTPAPSPTATPTPAPPTATAVTAAPAPSVSQPTSAVTTANMSYPVRGTARAGHLVQIWNDANGNGARDAREKLVASQQLPASTTTFALSVPLRRNAVNTFVATAADASGAQSPAATVPAITQASARK